MAGRPTETSKNLEEEDMDVSEEDNGEPGEGQTMVRTDISDCSSCMSPGVADALNASPTSPSILLAPTP